MQVDATLFFAAPLGAGLQNVETEIRRSFSDQGVPVRAKFASPSDLVLGLDDLTLTIAYSPVPLDLTLFSQSRMPETYFGLPALLQRVLAGHRCAIGLRISGRKGASQHKTRTALCYMATRCVLAVSEPQLIHWGTSDTLYTLSAFFRQIGENVPSQSEQSPNHSAASQHVDGQHARNQLALQQRFEDPPDTDSAKRLWPLGAPGALLKS